MVIYIIQTFLDKHFYFHFTNVMQIYMPTIRPIHLCLQFCCNIFVRDLNFLFCHVFLPLTDAKELKMPVKMQTLMGVEWVHCLFLFPLVLGKL